LPLKYNDNRFVEEIKFTETYDDIIKKCRGITIEDTPIMGAWINPETGQTIEDEIIVYWAICYDLDENIEFLRSLKHKLKKRFDQDEIMLYYIQIERLKPLIRQMSLNRTETKIVNHNNIV
jgi:hypothetical protein